MAAYDIDVIASTGSANFLDSELDLAATGIQLTYEDDILNFFYSETHLSFLGDHTAQDSNAVDLTTSDVLAKGAYEQMLSMLTTFKKQAGSQALANAVFLISPDKEQQLMLDPRYAIGGSDKTKEEIYKGFSRVISSVPCIVCDRINLCHPDFDIILVDTTRIEQYVFNKTKLKLTPAMTEEYPDGTYFMKFLAWYNYYLSFNTGESFTGIYMLRNSLYGLNVTDAYYTIETPTTAVTLPTITGKGVTPTV
jgi:hypothetical protein